VTVYRAVSAGTAKRGGGPLSLGLQPEPFEGARVFVLPNPSGRNANFTYAQMLDAYRGLAAYLLPPIQRGHAK
jgi:TDG/mug DNA glycosylase family protein